MARFIGLLSQGDLGTLNVVFPDIPGCTAGGDTIKQVQKTATENLLIHIEDMLQDSRQVPKPSTFEQALADPNHESKFAIVIYVLDVESLSRESVAMGANYNLNAALLRPILGGVPSLNRT